MALNILGSNSLKRKLTRNCSLLMKTLSENGLSAWSNFASLPNSGVTSKPNKLLERAILPKFISLKDSLMEKNLLSKFLIRKSSWAISLRKSACFMRFRWWGWWTTTEYWEYLSFTKGKILSTVYVNYTKALTCFNQSSKKALNRKLKLWL